MDIQDILRGLPFPMQGALMSIFGAQGQSGNGSRQPTSAVQDDGSYDAMGNYTGMGSGILSQPAQAAPAAPAPAPNRPRQFPKDEAGFESLITRVMANDSGTPPQVPALPVTEVPNLPPVAAAMAQEPAGPSAASMAPDNRDVGGGQNFAMQGPNPMQAASGQGNGILGYLDNAVGYSQPDFLSRFGTALAVAGSQDPAKALMMVQQNRNEEAKVAEARRKANMPKFDPIAGTPFSQVTYPDGRVGTVNNEELAKFYKEQASAKATSKRSDMELQADLNVRAASGKADIKAADEARPQLAQVRETINTMQRALAVTNEQGTWDQVQAAPLISGVAEFFGTPGAAGNKVLQQLKVDDALRNTAQTKGAISNQEMDLFLSPAPSPTADRQAIWKPWIENKISVFKRLEQTLESEVARAPSSGGAPAAAASPAAPAASGGVARPASKADYDALPKGAKYIAPNGMELTKK